MEATLTTLKKTRSRAKAAITRVETFISNSENDITIDINEYSIREPFLVKAFEDYIIALNAIEDLDESQEHDRVEVEQRYLSLSAKLKRIMQRLSRVNLSNNNTRNRTSSPENIPRGNASTPLGAAIPKISLPTFSGKYDEWNAFIDLFTVLVDNNDQFSAAQKFVYLKTHLADEPSREIGK